jgi:hypothetical protein
MARFSTWDSACIAQVLFLHLNFSAYGTIAQMMNHVIKMLQFFQLSAQKSLSLERQHVICLTKSKSDTPSKW